MPQQRYVVTVNSRCRIPADISQGDIPSRNKWLRVRARYHRCGHLLPEEPDPRVRLQLVAEPDHHLHRAADRQGVLRAQQLAMGFRHLGGLVGRAVPAGLVSPAGEHAQGESSGSPPRRREERLLDPGGTAAALG